MFTSSRLALAVLSIATLFAPAGAQLPGARPVTRAMWVTRFDVKTKDDCAHIVENAAACGVNTILFQVRGNATVLYRSAFEPWSEQLAFKDPGFDPLTTMLDLGHARGMKVHAWVNVMPAWWGTVPPSDAKQLWNVHPEWMWYDQNGKRQALCEHFYVSVNPCLPEVRKYVVDVLRDLVAHYAIDGLHLDYIRFPNEDPAIPKGSGLDYPRDAKTLAIYDAETGKTPDLDRPAWNRWRADQVTILLRDIRAMVKKTRVRCELSAAVGPVPEVALEHYQDYRTWIAEGLLDVVFPMNYAADLALWRKRAEAWKKIAAGTPVVMGVMMGSKDVETQHTQLADALRAFRGYCMFAYAKLFDSPGDQLEKQDENARFERSQNCKTLLPLLVELAKSGG